MTLESIPARICDICKDAGGEGVGVTCLDFLQAVSFLGLREDWIQSEYTLQVDGSPVSAIQHTHQIHDCPVRHEDVAPAAMYAYLLQHSKSPLDLPPTKFNQWLDAAPRTYQPKEGMEQPAETLPENIPDLDTASQLNEADTVPEQTYFLPIEAKEIDGGTLPPDLLVTFLTLDADST